MKYERRMHERHRIPIPVSLGTRDGQNKTMQLRDVSFSGAFLEVPGAEASALPLGAEVQITIQYQSEQGAEAETVRGRVVRIQPDGIGIRFLRMASIRAA